MPAVTVCIPTYEPHPAHLKAAVDSVFAQTVTDWELIIHDDASTSNVEEMIRLFLKDPRVKFFQSTKRLGIGGNWNATMRRGSAPFVAYLFQDDLWKPTYLEKSLKILQSKPDIGFVAANHSYRIEGASAAAETGIYKEVEDLRRSVMKEGQIHRADFLRMWIEQGLRPNLIGEPSFVVLRRSLMENVGPFLEDMQQGLDAEYWIRCLLKSDGYWIADDLGMFRVHASGATAMNEESGAGRTDRLRMFKSLIARLPEGEIKTLAKKVRRRETLKMVGKFLRKTTGL